MRLLTFGGLAVEPEQGSPHGAAAQRRPLALLALLAGTGGMSRDKLVAFLWPESDEASARNALKQLVYAIRRDLACPDLITGSTELRLNADHVRVDLWDFQAAIKERRNEDAVDLYRGPFLDGVFVSGAPDLDRWVEERRTELAAQFVAAAEAVVASSLERRDFARAVTVSRRMAVLEPLNGRLALSLIRVLAASGDRSGALQHAESYRVLLRTELDVDPEPELDTLVARLRDDDVPSPALSTLATSVPVAPVYAPASVDGAVSAPAAERAPRARWRGAVLPGGIALVAILIFAAWVTSRGASMRYRRGRAALASWDVEGARIHFKDAIAADSSYARAYLALAELASWKPTDPSARDEQRWAAGLALNHASQLDPAERVRAKGLASAANEQWDEACRHFSQLIGQDSTSYSAWFGRAECLARDGRVLPDSASPSGWRFRSSYQDAIRSYLRAFDLRPDFHRAFGGHAIAHLSRVLFLQPNRMRRGTPEQRSAGQFAAFAGWESDTIAFVPFPLDAIQRGVPGSTPETTLEAVANNKETLRRLTALWVVSSPDSPDAFEAQASVLEQLGELDVSRGGTTATQALARARQLSRVPDQALRLAVTDVRFRVKRSRFAEARALADSLLASWPDPNSVVAQWLAPTAALTGRANLAAKLQRIAAPLAPPPFTGARRVETPMPVTGSWLALTTFAAMGGPADSISATYAQLESLLRLIQPATRSALRSAMLQEPARFLYDWLPDSARTAVDSAADPVIAMRASLRSGRRADVRQRLAALERSRAGFRLADRWPDAVLLESRIMLALGDTVSVVNVLDPYLDALPVLNSAALDRVQTAASLMHLFKLRVDLAAVRRDSSALARWTRAAQELRSSADR
jgi:DNA-binding SARP family transcriptional activator